MLTGQSVFLLAKFGHRTEGMTCTSPMKTPESQHPLSLSPAQSGCSGSPLHPDSHSSRWPGSALHPDSHSSSQEQPPESKQAPLGPVLFFSFPSEVLTVNLLLHCVPTPPPPPPFPWKPQRWSRLSCSHDILPLGKPGGKKVVHTYHWLFSPKVADKIILQLWFL